MMPAGQYVCGSFQKDVVIKLVLMQSSEPMLKPISTNSGSASKEIYRTQRNLQTSGFRRSGLWLSVIGCQNNPLFGR